VQVLVGEDGAVPLGVEVLLSVGGELGEGVTFDLDELGLGSLADDLDCVNEELAGFGFVPDELA